MACATRRYNRESKKAIATAMADSPKQSPHTAETETSKRTDVSDGAGSQYSRAAAPFGAPAFAATLQMHARSSKMPSSTMPRTSIKACLVLCR